MPPVPISAKISQGSDTTLRQDVSGGAGLASAPINVVVQDRRNKDLLIVGNDLGVWISLNAGTAWMRLKADLPTLVRGFNLRAPD